MPAAGHRPGRGAALHALFLRQSWIRPLPLFLSDTFTDVDGTLLDAHLPNVGGMWTALDDDLANPNALTQTAKVLTNQAVSTSSTSRSRGYRNPAVPSSAEYDIIATFVVGNVTSTESIWGLGARLSPTGTTTNGYDRYVAYYTGDPVAGNRKWWIAMVVGGSWTGLASFAEDLTAGSYRMKFEVRNTTKKLYVDYGSGFVLRASTTDNTITQVGRVGICLPRATSTNAMDALVASAPLGVITDNFNRADNVSTLGTTSDGTTTWTTFSGTWGINGNQAYCSADGGASRNFAVITTSSADGTVQATLPVASFAGLVVRAQDANNYVQAAYNTGGNLDLYKYVAGNPTLLAHCGTVTNGDVLAVVLAGSSYTVKKNGATVGSATDSTYLTQTKHGLLLNSSTTTSRWDDFSFTPPTPPPWRPIIRSRAINRASVI